MAMLRSIWTICKEYRVLLLSALLIRLILMPFVYHPDIKVISFQAQFFQDDVFNIYTYLAENRALLPYKEPYVYPILTYYVTGVWEMVTSPLLGKTFFEWLNYAGSYSFEHFSAFRGLFVLKIPYLICDFGIGMLLYKMLDEQFRKKALILWFFNPLTLYIIYGLSNFDIIPTFVSVLALYYYKSEKYIKTGVCLGIGMALKMYPLLFIPFFGAILINQRKIKQALLLAVTAALTFLIPVLPIFKDFLSISNSGLMQTVLTIKLPDIFGLQLPIFMPIFGALVLIALIKPASWMRLNLYIVILLFAIISITRIHPQWLLWVLPFLTLLVAKNLKLLIPFTVMTICYFVIVLAFEDRFLVLGILQPIITRINDLPNIEQTLFMRINKDVALLMSQLGLAIGTVIIYWQNRKQY